MATSIECSACGHTVPADQHFCGMCGTAVHATSSGGPEAAQPSALGELLDRVRIPWSLGLLGVLVMGSLFLGGDEPPVQAFPETVAAPSPADVETLPEAAVTEVVPEAAVIEVVPEDVAPVPDELDSDDRRAQEAAAARLALIEAEIAAEEQRQMELVRQAEAARERSLQEQAQAQYEEAQAPAAPDADPPATEPGSLRLIVLPFGDIYINGALEARDMSRFSVSMAPGTYDVLLVNATRQPFDTTIVILAGESTGLRVTLRPRNR